MGLDMYLYAERYVSGWDFRPDDKPVFDKISELVGMTAHPNSPSITVDVTVGYWRKANHIHKWFVDNVQDGKDECQRSYVSREQLTDLRDTCKAVLGKVELIPGVVHNGDVMNADTDGEFVPLLQDGLMVDHPQSAEELLPTASGFFFGGTDYDEYYLADVRETVEIIDAALKLTDVDFYYQSSW